MFIYRCLYILIIYLHIEGFFYLLYFNVSNRVLFYMKCPCTLLSHRCMYDSYIVFYNKCSIWWSKTTYILYFIFDQSPTISYFRPNVINQNNYYNQEKLLMSKQYFFLTDGSLSAPQPNMCWNILNFSCIPVEVLPSEWTQVKACILWCFVFMTDIASGAYIPTVIL